MIFRFIVRVTRQKTDFLVFFKIGGHFLASPIAYIVEESFSEKVLRLENTFVVAV